jgi:iron uptake system component EfeO
MFVPLPRLVLLALLAPLAACGSDDGSDDAADRQAVALTAQQTARVDRGAEKYADYVRTETDLLLAGTARFVAAYKDGDDDRARALYAPTRMHWEAIEPVAETFGALDPRTDAREADLAEGDEWAGWHLIEKDLWPAEAEAGYQALDDGERTEYADRLLTDLTTLKGEVAVADYTGEQIANGAKELLDEVANGKVTGEEEFWSHTDLYDFQANVDGARVAFEGLRPVLQAKDPALEKQIEQRFAALQALLDKHKVGDEDFVTYDKLTRDEVKQLSDAVNALSEPLSKLTAAVTL